MNERIEQLNTILDPYRRGSNNINDVAKNGMSLGTAKKLAEDYYPSNAASPQIMSAGISQIWNEDLRIHLVVNLYEECGNGYKDQSHITLFEKFMHAVDVDPKTLPRSGKPGSHTENLIYNFLKVCSEGPDYRAIAILHGFEDLFSYTCGKMSDGIKQSKIVDPGDGEFFELHSTTDVIHADRMRDSMFGAADTEDKWKECLELVEFGARLQYDLFDEACKN